MHFILFFDSTTSEVPDTLLWRTETYTMALVGVLALSFLLITLSRLSNNRAITTVISVLFKNATVEQVLKENMRLNSFSSIILLLNYFICFSLCCFIFFNRVVLLDNFWSLSFSLAIPIALFIIETAGLYIVGMIAGESKQLSITLINSITINQLTGIFYSVLALFWIMNPEFNRVLMGIFVLIVALKYLIRGLKNSIVVLINGVSWYYIILYFCTLEILPLFVVYYYVKQNFNL